VKLSKSVKSISYLKGHAAELLKELSISQQPLIVTQNGEAKAVVQDIVAYEKTQESLALLKILAQSSNSIKQDKTKSVGDAFEDIRKHIADSDN
jgi:prevent-host-death family protein